MYEGYMAIDGLEVVNTHRAAAYAMTAGLGWVQGCQSCSSVVRAIDGEYVSPKLDVEKPPWWVEDNPDSMDFLGLIGVSVSNVDDSMRSVPVQSGAASGGFIGGLRFAARTITVRAIAIAASDCALGFGLEWLRGINADESCSAAVVEMFDCCPTLSQDDCDDPECVDQCVMNRLRMFYEARITEGPTVLSRREMPTRGAWAQIEFVVTAGDPFIYSFVPAIAAGVPESEFVMDPLDIEEPVSDPFSTSTPYPVPPSRSRGSLPPRGSWMRQSMPVTKPQYGNQFAPVVSLSTVGGSAEDVRVTLMSGGEPLSVFRLPFLPEGGTVTVDYRDRTVRTKADGVTRLNTGFARSESGAPMQWPKELLFNGAELLVDRAVGDPPLAIGVVAQGRGQP